MKLEITKIHLEGQVGPGLQYHSIRRDLKGKNDS